MDWHLTNLITITTTHLINRFLTEIRQGSHSSYHGEICANEKQQPLLMKIVKWRLLENVPKGVGLLSLANLS